MIEGWGKREKKNEKGEKGGEREKRERRGETYMDRQQIGANRPI